MPKKTITRNSVAYSAGSTILIRSTTISPIRETRYWLFHPDLAGALAFDTLEAAKEHISHLEGGC